MDEPSRKKIKQSTISTLSHQENQPNKSNNTILSFGIKAQPLKRAISSLTNPEVNQQVLGRINISAHGFDITVRDLNNEVLGSIFLRSSALSDFLFCPPNQNPSMRLTKTVNLADISKKLVACHDEDVITVCLLEGFTQLFFMFGNISSKGFSVELLEPDAEVEMTNKCRTANSPRTHTT